ncbi:MAG: hypothetical protein JST90_15780 [Bacteroidetes bacterium]|nr:hypothetical protein [Bacteroidota bacterium]
MKKLILLPCLCIALLAAAQKAPKPAITVEVKHNGVSHTVQEGDTIHLGYGSTPYGSFMFVENGAPPQGMLKQYGGKSGLVTKVKYWKSIDQYQLYIKVPGAGSYVVNVPQAVDKDEVIGFNQDWYKKN